MTIDWNGCWEDRSDRIICRWMVAWTNVCGVVAGCVGGYSGGGCFQLEKFIKNGDKFDIECNTDPSDKFGLDIIQATEDCQDLVLLFHDENMWLESDNLILNYDQVSNLVRENDLLIGGTDLPPNFNLLFEHIGLISAVR